MPYTTEWKKKGYCIKYTGVVSNDEVIQASLDMQGDPRFDDLKYILSDYLAIDDIDYDLDKFREEISLHAYLNEAASKSNAKIKRAIVATHETVLTFASFYDEKSSDAQSPWEFKTFSSVAEAEDWIFD